VVGSQSDDLAVRRVSNESKEASSARCRTLGPLISTTPWTSDASAGREEVFRTRGRTSSTYAWHLVI